MTSTSVAEFGDTFSDGFSDEPGYLDVARIGPISRAAREEDAAQLSLLGRARFGTLDSLFEQDARVRESLAALLGFPAGQIVFQPSTTQAMTHALFGIEGEVLVSTNEYPGVTFAATRSEEAFGRIDARWFTPEHGHVTPDDLRELITPDTEAVVVSHVDFRTGYRIDLEAVREVIGDRLMIVDAVQGFGVVDAPWHVADVVACGGQKWLRAGVGTGFMALSERGLGRIHPVMSGFAAFDGSDVDAQETPEPPRAAAAFQLSRPDPVAQARLAASLEDLATTGLPSVAGRITENVTRIIDLADEFGVPVVSPRDESERAGIVVVEPSEGTLAYLTASLHNHGVTVTSRGSRVRLSPPATTDEETFAMLRAALISYGTVAQ